MKHKETSTKKSRIYTLRVTNFSYDGLGLVLFCPMDEDASVVGKNRRIMSHLNFHIKITPLVWIAQASRHSPQLIGSEVKLSGVIRTVTTVSSVTHQNQPPFTSMAPVRVVEHPVVPGVIPNFGRGKLISSYDSNYQRWRERIKVRPNPFLADALKHYE